ncbi:hypothetical protein AVEN_258432-1 [Araneus ventricosus]|uniref:Uncharacterized protein n=1 Tax=Araneus ventricosus TaxID=182803 RepID=A0A4Y2DIR7_ARAVE|nr:hypothetical protein AVEN_258432-1 [Araneus ventricosus]
MSYEFPEVAGERADDDILADVVLCVLSTSAVAVFKIESFQVVRTEAMVCNLLCEVGVTYTPGGFNFLEDGVGVPPVSGVGALGKVSHFETCDGTDSGSRSRRKLYRINFKNSYILQEENSKEPLVQDGNLVTLPLPTCPHWQC